VPLRSTLLEAASCLLGSSLGILLGLGFVLQRANDHHRVATVKRKVLNSDNAEFSDFFSRVAERSFTPIRDVDCSRPRNTTKTLTLSPAFKISVDLTAFSLMIVVVNLSQTRRLQNGVDLVLAAFTNFLSGLIFELAEIQ
jgi:hypothetical protein